MQSFGLDTPTVVLLLVYSHVDNTLFEVSPDIRCSGVSSQFCTASPTTYFNDCSLYKMLRQVNHADGLPWTHLTCSAGIALGCLSDAVSTSNWQHWCLSRYTAAHAPSYLSEACKSAPEASLHRHLHSSAAITCITPWSTTRLGDRSFDVTVTRTVVSLRRVQISAWGQSASPSPLVCCHHMHHTVVQNSSERQVVWCHRNAALEQAACFTAVVWQSLPVQKTVENVFVCQGLGWGA